MRWDRWRLAVGPLVTFVVANGLIWFERSGSGVPAPGVLLLLSVAFSAYVGGLWAGYLSAAVALGYGVTFLFGSEILPSLSFDREARLEILLTFALLAPPLIAALKLRAERTIARERQMREQAEADSRELGVLRAALDNVDYGVILLDKDMRARFINRASRRLWKMPAALADRIPSFEKLMRHARNSSAYAVPPEELDAFVERRIALVRAGDETPIDLRLADGRIIRFQCKALPEGGRFLSYTDVTDLVRGAEEFERLATTDSLTGICNRRHFLALADDQWRRFERDRAPLALLIFDIDLFKSINDRFGHNIGDAVINHVIDICRKVARRDDILARIGGEEFVLLLPATTGEHAVELAEKMRQRLDAAPIVIEGNSMTVTMSVGVATADDAMRSIGDLMKLADQALYDAKRGGRNRVRYGAPTQQRERAAGTSAAA